MYMQISCLSLCEKEAELLEPLMPAIRNCLEHRHSYVRRNAVMAIYTIYRYVSCTCTVFNEESFPVKKNGYYCYVYGTQCMHAGDNFCTVCNHVSRILANQKDAQGFLAVVK